MSELVKPYLNKLKSIEGNLEQIATNIVEENLDFIYYLIKDRQLNKGIDSEGKVIGTYKKITQKWAQDPYGYKPRKEKPPGQPYNLEWTGDYIDSLTVKLEQDGFSIFSRDAKANLLRKKYGEILKLTDEHNTQVNNELILPELQKYILENMFDV